jgi:hypothetical protein
VRGLRKGSKRRSEALKEDIVEIGVQGLKKLRVGGSVQVYICIYNFW